MSGFVRAAGVAALSGLLVLTVGCASSSNGGGEPAPAASSSPPPAGSPLAQVQMGMSDEEVRNVLGNPSSSNSYMTGKAWIPFYYGPDTHRTDWVYTEHRGRVVFSRNRWTGALKVIRVAHEP